MSLLTKSEKFFPPNSSTAWVKAVKAIFADGQGVAPRGKHTIELLGPTCEVDMNSPVVAVADRQLSYKFMAAEALWILSGSNKVADIAPYNPRIADFSDDGQIFFGAYGPWVVDQLDYVVRSLLRDRETRQAVMTIWQRNPAPSKDIPCTVALTFSIRAGTLHCHAFMRSSDVWLGLPYDIFNFSMVAAKVACQYNLNHSKPVSLGTLRVTAASSHLYQVNWEDAKKAVEGGLIKNVESVPDQAIKDGFWDVIETSLIQCRDHSVPGPWRIRPW